MLYDDECAMFYGAELACPKNESSENEDVENDVIWGGVILGARGSETKLFEIGRDLWTR